jgi:hypothetical protein
MGNESKEAKGILNQEPRVKAKRLGSIYQREFYYSSARTGGQHATGIQGRRYPYGTVHCTVYATRAWRLRMMRTEIKN